MKIYWFNYRDPDRPTPSIYAEIEMPDNATIDDARRRLEKQDFDLSTIFAEGMSEPTEKSAS